VKVYFHYSLPHNCMEMASYTPRPLYPRGKYPLVKKLDRVENLSGRNAGYQPRTVQPVAIPWYPDSATKLHLPNKTQIRNITEFYGVTAYLIYRRFGGTCCIYLEGKAPRCNTLTVTKLNSFF
jgi:hypothetical protein